MHGLRKWALLALAVFFVAAGANHFVNPSFYVRITPPSLPSPLSLVYVSGLFEVLGGVGVLVPSVRSAAGWGLVLLLIAVFPANLYMAINPDRFSDIPVAFLYLRLPLQAVFVAWAFWATRPTH
ncbi:MAG TPA: DoxX family protein [Vicinamibacterales bacterium]